MKRILFLTESYEPKPSPNAICSKRVLDELHGRGYDTQLITLRNALGQAKEEEIDGTKVRRLFEGIINGSMLRLQEKPGAVAKVLRSLVGALSHLKGAVMGFFYPLLSPWEVLRYYRAAKRLHQEQSLDVMVCVYHKIAAVLAGVLMKRKHPDIHMIVYTLDAVSGGWVPNIFHSHAIPMRSLKRWEKIMFGTADAVFAMESHRLHYQPAEYDYCRSKLHFLDIPLMVPRTSEYEPLKSKGKIHLVYTGSMAKATANPAYLLRLLEHPGVAELVQVDLYGTVAPEIMAELEHSPLYQAGVVVCHGRVAHDEILRVQERADVLLNFGNANPCMIPCKIFEYMSTGGRIISFTHSEFDSSLPYMNRYPNALIMQEDEDRIEENALAFQNYLKDSLAPVSSKVLCETFRANTPEYFVAMLETVCSTRQSG